MTTGDRIPARWDRIVLKVSGEAFAGEAGYGIDGEIVGRIARDISDVRSEFDVDIAVVVGGGNIWRGMSGAGAGMDRAQADYMGMLATSINALAPRTPLNSSVSPPGSKRPSTWSRSPSRISVAGPFDTSRRVGS